MANWDFISKPNLRARESISQQGCFFHPHRCRTALDWHLRWRRDVASVTMCRIT